MRNSITQDMRFRQSLMQYAAKYGVSRASRKYNKARSYIYFWKARWGGSTASLACQSRRPHHHPNQHTEAERKLIRDMRRRNPTLGMVELWHRLRKRGYTRCPISGQPTAEYWSKPYSVRSATTGSFFAALLEGIIPENKVSAILIKIKTTAIPGGR